MYILLYPHIYFDSVSVALSTEQFVTPVRHAPMGEVMLVYWCVYVTWSSSIAACQVRVTPATATRGPVLVREVACRGSHPFTRRAAPP